MLGKIGIPANETLHGTQKVDWIVLSLYLALVSIGWAMIHAVWYRTTSQLDILEFLKVGAGKQLLFIGMAIVLIAIVMTIDWKFWRIFAYLIYAIGILLLIAVLIFGKEINGAKAWFSLGFMSLQPAEIAKFGTCLALSSFLSTFKINLREPKNQLLAVGIIFFPVLFILLQPDVGSALVFFSFFILLYREGFPKWPYFIGFVLVVLFIASLIWNVQYILLGLFGIISVIYVLNIKNARNWWIALISIVTLSILLANFNWLSYANILLGSWVGVLTTIFLMKGQGRLATMLFGILTMSIIISFSTNYVFNNILEPHQRDRINVWLQPQKCDPRGSLYNLLQAKMAIGSGGFLGKGYLQGNMTKLNYVPEQDTDFIFCTIGEEQGFIGVAFVILIYLGLIYRIVIIAERQRSNFSRHYAYGVAGIIFFHFFINIGMTMGLLPVVGIPLPFISYGGSSLLGFTLLIAILLRLDSYRYSV